MARLAELSKGQSPADTYTKQLLYELKDFQTKLRPGIFDLLQKMQHIFRLYVYTMGDEAYACAMANLIDPSGSLFRNRILNREDANWVHHQKGLDKLGVPPSMAVVVDDTVGVSLPLWTHLSPLSNAFHISRQNRSIACNSPRLRPEGHQCPSIARFTVNVKCSWAAPQRAA
jgi:TFIIF-interacting CTD phosphatase-like protein